MKKKLLIILALSTIITSMCACSKSENTQIKSSMNIQKFSTDNSTVRKSHLSGVSSNEEEDKKQVIEHNEITISGEDTTPSYEVIDNAHIKYEGVTYTDLYTNVNNMEIPYDKTLFINFIVKTYSPSSNTVTTLLTTDSNSEGSSGATIAEELQQVWSEYASIRNKYGADVKYQLHIYQGKNTDRAILYTCKEYMLYRGTSGDMNVNMDIINGGN